MQPGSERAGGPALAEPSGDRALEARGRGAIEVRGLRKSFRIPEHRPATLKERVLHPLRRVASTEIRAAQGISFSVEPGEFFGIVGRNGSGKSTLLRLLAGIYKPDGGSVSVQGRVSPFIELGVGFNLELEARDNVLINGNLLGLSRRETRSRYRSIMSFADLEPFEDMKLKNYSSGMLVRLAFSIAIQVDADVLLLDEVLAVGDANFQEKCFEQFRQMKREGRTIVLVTHGMDTVRRFCDRAMMLERGEMVALGDPDEIAERYREAASEELASVTVEEAGSARFGDRSATVEDAWVEDASGRRVEVVEQGERIRLCARFEFPKGADHPVLGIQVRGESGADVVAINTMWAEQETPRFEPGERATLRIELENQLGVGAHWLTPGVASRDAASIADIRFHMAGFRVDGPRWTGAAVDPPSEITIERDRGR